MESFRNHFISKDVMEQKQAVEQVRHGLVESFDIEGLRTNVICGGVLATTGEPAHLTDGIFSDTDFFPSRHLLLTDDDMDNDNNNDNDKKKGGNEGGVVVDSYKTPPHREEKAALLSEKDNGSANTVMDALLSLRRSPTAEGTRLFLRALLQTPVCDASTLHARRETLLRMMKTAGETEREKQAAEANDGRYDTEKEKERDVVWIFGDVNEAESTVFDMAFFKPWLLNVLNKMPWALTALNVYKIGVFPLMGILGPVVTFLVPYAVLRWKIGLRISLRTYLWIMYRSFVAGDIGSVLGGRGGRGDKWTKYFSAGITLVFYFQSLFTSLEMSRALRVVCGCIDTRMRNVSAFFKRAAKVVDESWDDGVRDAFFPDVQRPSEDVVRTASSDEHGTSRPGACKYACTLGNSLSRYHVFKTYHKEREKYKNLARAYYAVDALRLVCDLVKRCDFRVVQWTFGSSVPHVRMQGLWHPCLSPDKAVDNDLVLDASRSAANLILTGPNAGGKSMLIKASVISILLAQSIGIAPCRTGALCTPFSFVSSQINVPDVKGKRSLFEEEMFRAKTNLDVLRATAVEKQRLAFIVIDEIFSSTNPVEGIAGACSVAANLARHPHACCIISTHYTYICRLQKTTGRFLNVQMPVRECKTDEGETRPQQKGDDEVEKVEYEYPYKLVPGICRQYIALELLRQNGFDKEVVDDAIRVKCTLAD